MTKTFYTPDILGARHAINDYYANYKGTTAEAFSAARARLAKFKATSTDDLPGKAYAEFITSLGFEVFERDCA